MTRQITPGTRRPTSPERLWLTLPMTRPETVRPHPGLYRLFDFFEFFL